MSNVIPLRHYAQPDRRLYDSFEVAREAFLVAYLAWMESRPPADIVQSEIDSTFSAMRQVAQIYAVEDGS